MRDLVKVSAKTCAKCKYRMGFGSQPSKKQKDEGHCMNVACNYIKIMQHSRIFENGEMAYDPKYCDKFEKGDAVDPEEEHETTFQIQSVRYRKSKQITTERWQL